MPKWDGPKYADIGDPKRRGATNETTLARSPPSPSSIESSSGASPTSASPTEDLAISAVFQVLIRTSTWNCFLEAGCLAKLVDEDEQKVGRILKNRKGELPYPAYTIFLRSFGIIERPYTQKTRWCLLGLGALDLTLQDCHHREHVMSAEPKGPLLCATSALREEAPTTLPEGYNVLDVGMEFVEFNDDVRRELRCRRCRTPVSARGWWYVRLESVASHVLKPGSEAEVGLAFRCECGALHFGEPLPTLASTGSAWSSADTVEGREDLRQGPQGMEGSP